MIFEKIVLAAVAILCYLLVTVCTRTQGEAEQTHEVKVYCLGVGASICVICFLILSILAR